MSTFSVIAVPFLVMSVVMFILAIFRKEKAFLILGCIFTTTTVVNAVLGLSLH